MGELAAACLACPWLKENGWWALPAGGIVLVALVVVFRYQVFVRFPLWFLSHTVYRVRVHGLENIPDQGPALLVSNHISQLDGFLVLAAVKKRRIRFVIWAPYLSVPGVRVLLRMGRVIPIDSKGGPRAIVAALHTASEALAQGELVCIFPEGGITRQGFMLPFQRGFKKIVERTAAPIIPVALDHVWGSIFSYERGRFFWKWPREIPYRIWVNFGKPLPATASVFEVRQAVQKLLADSAIRRIPSRPLVHQRFVRMATRHPFRRCLVDPSATTRPVWTFGQVLASTKILTKILAPILKEDRMVGVWIPPGIGGVSANVTLAFLGKTSVNLNYSVSMPVIQSAIRQCGIRHVLTSKLFCSKVPLDPGPGVELIYLEDFRKVVTSWMRLRAFLSVLLLPGFIHERWILGLGNHQPDDLLTIVFSSGTTGEPKGVMLTHANIAANTESMRQAIDPGPKDRMLGILPFFHSFGYSVTLWVPLQVGAMAVYYPNPLQAREIGELCRKHQCTIFLSTPTFLRTFTRRCEPGDFSSLRLLACGAEKLPQAVAREFQEKFGVLPLEAYGCTELSPAANVNVHDWEENGVRQIGNKPGTIGRTLPGVAAKIVRKDSLEDLPENEEGRLLVFGANVMKGYLGKEELTKQKVVDGGWYLTGDLGKIDEDGFVTITGRQERFAKVGGEMVPLELVEEELHATLNTSERLLAVTAVPDARRGEKLIVLHLPLETMTIADLLSKVRERGLPNIYVPDQRDFYQVSEIPILGSGKLDLVKCREKGMELSKKS